jgi:hypothetical protein
LNPGQLAALIAAVFFAAGVCVAAYVLLKLGGLLTAATGYLTGMRQQADALIEQAHAAIDRTNEQLDRTDAITSNMTEVSANVAELTEHVSALAGLGRALATGPVGKASAVAYGVRHAVDLRRAGRGSPVMAPPPVPGGRSAAELAAGTAAARGAGSLAAGTAARGAGSLGGAGLTARFLAARAIGRSVR